MNNFIKKLTIESKSSKPYVIDFDEKHTIIHSNGINSSGKTTIIRSILYGMGLIQNDNFVDGSNIEGLNVIVELLVNDKKINVSRNKGAFRLFIDEDIVFESKAKKAEDFEDISNHYDMHFRTEINVIKLFLFSNYFDQNYGGKVANRGKTGLFPKNFNFDINKTLSALDPKLKEYEMLKKQESVFKKYESDYSQVIKHAKIESNQVSLDIFQTEEIQRQILIQQIAKLKALKNFKLSEQRALKAFKKGVASLEMFYEKENGDFEKLTVDNFKHSSDFNEKKINDELNFITNKLSKINAELDKVKIGDKDLELLRKIKEKIELSKISVKESEFETLKSKRKEIIQKINKLDTDVKIINFKKIHDKFIKYLELFSKASPDIEGFISRLENEKINGIKHYNILLDSSKFTTYVGAIRFMITFSLKMSIADYIREDGVNLPIIMDSIIFEELSEDVKAVFWNIINSRREQLIITSLNFDDIKVKNNVQEVLVEKNISKSINIFSTLE